MATRYPFTPESAAYPSSNFPFFGKDAQSRHYLAFDASTDESCYWTGIAPQGLTGTLSGILTYYMASATSGAVRFQLAIEKIRDGDSIDLSASSSFDTDNSAGETVPGTAGYPSQLTVTLTNADSIAAGDYFRVRLKRDADGTSGTDDATGDCLVLALEIRDGA